MRKFTNTEEIREIWDEGLTAEEMCDVVQMFWNQVFDEPPNAKDKLWNNVAGGEIWPLYEQTHIAIFYFDEKHNGVILREEL